jgi:hypothetical protein
MTFGTRGTRKARLIRAAMHHESRMIVMEPDESGQTPRGDRSGHPHGWC